MKFTEVTKGRWESDVKSVSAAMLAGPNRELKAIHEPRFIIKEGDYKGNTVYRLYKQLIGRKEFLKRFKTVEAAIKYAEKEVQ